MSKILESFEFKGRKLLAVQGDITEEAVDAIVNAANSLLKHGGGVAGAIVKKGGKVIQEESDRIVAEKGPIPVGKAVYTSGGKLKAKYVIHTVGPVWGEGNEDEKLRSAIKSVMEIADSLKISSISVPAVSTGIFGYPKEEGIKTIVEETVKFLKENPQTTIKEIHFIDRDRKSAELFATKLREVTSRT